MGCGNSVDRQQSSKAVKGKRQQDVGCEEPQSPASSGHPHDSPTNFVTVIPATQLSEHAPVIQQSSATSDPPQQLQVIHPPEIIAPKVAPPPLNGSGTKETPYGARSGVTHLLLFERLESMASFKSLISQSTVDSSRSLIVPSATLPARVKAKSNLARELAKPSAKTSVVKLLNSDNFHLCQLSCLGRHNNSNNNADLFVKKVYFPRAFKQLPFGTEAAPELVASTDGIEKAFVEKVEKIFLRLPTLGQKNTEVVLHVDFPLGSRNRNNKAPTHHQAPQMMFAEIQVMQTGQSDARANSDDDGYSVDGFMFRGDDEALRDECGSRGESPASTASGQHHHPQLSISVMSEYYEAGNVAAMVNARAAKQALPPHFHHHLITTEQQLRDLLRQVVLSLRYMHSHHNPHLWLTTSKIYFKSSGPSSSSSTSDIVVVDYGVGHLHANRQADDLYRLLLESKGSSVRSSKGPEEGAADPSLFPPEYIHGSSKLSNPLAADLWSLGVITCQLWFGINTDDGKTTNAELTLPSADFFEKILAMDVSSDGTIISKPFFAVDLHVPPTSANLNHFIRGLLSPTPLARVAAAGGSFDGLLKHPFLALPWNSASSSSLMSTSTKPYQRQGANPNASSRLGAVNSSHELLTYEEYIPQDETGDATSPDASSVLVDDLFDSIMTFNVVPVCSACSKKLVAIMYECRNCQQQKKYRLCTACYAHADDVHPASHTFVSSALVNRPGGASVAGASSMRQHPKGGLGNSVHSSAKPPNVKSSMGRTSQSPSESAPLDWGDDDSSQLLEESTIVSVPTSTLTSHEKCMLSTLGHLPSQLAVERLFNASVRGGGASMSTRPKCLQVAVVSTSSQKGGVGCMMTTKQTMASSIRSIPSDSVLRPGPPGIENNSPQRQLMSECEALGANDVDDILDDFIAASKNSCDQEQASTLSMTNLGLLQVPLRLLTISSSESFVSLTVLDLANNALATLPEDIELLVNLRKLSLENNLLVSLPDSIGQLDDLEELDLNRNRLQSIPDSLLCCEELKTVLLDYNELTAIPGFLFDHPSLKEVFLVENPGITSWPPVEVLSSMTRGLLLGVDNSPHLCPLTDEQADCLINGCQVNVSWHKIYPDLIMPNLYLGSLRTAQNQRVYDVLNIQHVLTVGRGLSALAPKPRGGGGSHKVIIIDDIVGVNIETIFAEAIEYLKSVLANGQEGGGACLVHCFAGLSRSATTVIAYLMMEKRMRLDDAYMLVKNGRPAIFPNDGFFCQLKALDEKLFPAPANRPLELSQLGR